MTTWQPADVAPLPTTVDDVLTLFRETLEAVPEAKRAAVLHGLAAVSRSPDRLAQLGWLVGLDLEAVVRGTEGREREALAYHEAGHVVAGLVGGLDIQHATILATPDATGAGAVRYWGIAADLTPRPALERVLAECAMNMAGPVAEELSGAEPDRTSYQVHVDETLAMAQHLKPYGGMDEVHAAVRMAEHRARGLLQQHWPAVVAVAQMLLSRGTLDRAALRRLTLGEGAA